jgi:hypothetical protein
VLYLSKITATISGPIDFAPETNEPKKEIEDFKSLLNELDENSKLNTALQLITRLNLIRDSDEAMINRKLYRKLDLSFNSLSQITSKNYLLKKMLTLMLTNYFAERYFFNKLQNYTASTALVDMSQTKDVIDILIQLFRRTLNKELIVEYAAALENFNSCLSTAEVKQIAEASILNKSPEENYSLNVIFSYHKKRLGAWSNQIQTKYDLSYAENPEPQHRKQESANTLDK